MVRVWQRASSTSIWLSSLRVRYARCALGELFREPRPVQPHIEVPVAELRAYEGTYELWPGVPFEVFLSGDRLMAGHRPDLADELLAREPDLFFTPEASRVFGFERGPDGEVTGILWEGDRLPRIR